MTFGNTSSGADIFGFDNLTIGSLQQVQPSTSFPEPASMIALLAFGVFGTTSLLKRKQQRATAKA